MLCHAKSISPGQPNSSVCRLVRIFNLHTCICTGRLSEVALTNNDRKHALCADWCAPSSWASALAAPSGPPAVAAIPARCSTGPPQTHVCCSLDAARGVQLRGNPAIEAAVCPDADTPSFAHFLCVCLWPGVRVPNTDRVSACLHASPPVLRWGKSTRCQLEFTARFHRSLLYRVSWPWVSPAYAAAIVLGMSATPVHHVLPERAGPLFATSQEAVTLAGTHNRRCAGHLQRLLQYTQITLK